MNGSTGYQTYFDPTKATSRTGEGQVTVTITLVPKTTPLPSAKK